MRYAFTDSKGNKMVFSATRNEINGFCGGSYYSGFAIAFASDYRAGTTFTECGNLKGVINLMADDCCTAHIAMHDCSAGVADTVFKELVGQEWEYDGNKISLSRSEPFHNWNSGNDCVVLTIRVMREKEECTCGCNSLDYDDDDGEGW